MFYIFVTGTCLAPCPQIDSPPPVLTPPIVAPPNVVKRAQIWELERQRFWGEATFPNFTFLICHIDVDGHFTTQLHNVCDLIFLEEFMF